MKLDKKTHAMNNYKPSGIEEKWQRKWEDTRLYQPNLEKSTRPFYNLHKYIKIYPRSRLSLFEFYSKSPCYIRQIRDDYTAKSI